MNNVLCLHAKMLCIFCVLKIREMRVSIISDLQQCNSYADYNPYSEMALVEPKYLNISERL